MKTSWCAPAVVLSVILFLGGGPAAAQFGNLLKGLEKAAGFGPSLSQNDIIDGLKEALTIGAGNAVGYVSEPNGYFGNPNIRIPLPPAVGKVETLLRGVGYGTKVDEFLLSMNRAAEQASPAAKAIFWDAIKRLSFEDARKILNGGENEATVYLKERTYDPLADRFEPMVRESMSAVGVTRLYQDLDGKVRNIPFAGSLSFDLDRYVTRGALDGLFFMLAEEERKIRQDPAARVTDLLRKVFKK